VAKKVVVEKRLANYRSTNENAQITAKAESLGLSLCQAHHCHDKTKSYIISAKVGEPGLLYTNDLKQVEDFLRSYESQQLASQRQAPTKISEDTKGGSKKEKAVVEDDVDTEKE